VIERLRERIRCIEGRSPVFDPAPVFDLTTSITPSLKTKLMPQPVPGPVSQVVDLSVLALPAPGAPREQSAGSMVGSGDDTRHQQIGSPATRRHMERSVRQTGFPADRLGEEDGDVLPRIALHASPSSPFLRFNSHFCSASDGAPPGWTLGDAGSDRDEAANALRTCITRLPLDVAGVHEIKPADQAVTTQSVAGNHHDWMASWGAARAFGLALAARRVAAAKAIDQIGAAVSRPLLLWCMPRYARFEQGALYRRGLARLGFSPADVLIVETSNAEETLWVLEEGLKSESLALVAGVIDDVALTPARRLGLAAQKYRTPCLLFTHPRTAPVSATSTRWRVSAARGALHPLRTGTDNGHVYQKPFLNSPGARRFAVLLERYRPAPEYVRGREDVVEWSDEAVCFHMVANLSDRSNASRATSHGGRSQRAAFRAG
jgi:hypothetical protein